MIPEKPLPYKGDFSSAEDYVEKLMAFSQSSKMFQILCGGVHIVDFFTTEPGHFVALMPEEWHHFLLTCDIMKFLDFLVRDDLDGITTVDGLDVPRELLEYARLIRNFSLSRDLGPKELPKLPNIVAVGMKPKKVHEVVNFSDFVGRLTGVISDKTGQEISHMVDFGSGQNYLGRALASEPFNKHVVAVEGREINVNAAKRLDITSKLAVKPKVRRNKKLWKKVVEIHGPNAHDDPEALAKTIKELSGEDAVEYRPVGTVGGSYDIQEGKGFVQYVSGRLDSGDLSEVISKIDRIDIGDERKQELKLMAISIHSCGNLSHYAIRSLILNPDIRAIAIVGCCYNLMTERLGPPSWKHAYLRPTLQAVNARSTRESQKFDPQGFPMSNRFSTYEGEGIRLNITARMMACQAPENWTPVESEAFFSRHFYRAVLQKLFLDRGVVGRVWHYGAPEGKEDQAGSPFDMSTNPIVIGTLRKSCYGSFTAYVRAAMEKLTTSSDYKLYAEVVESKMGDITDEEIEKYFATYEPRKKELSVIWSLMAFSAVAVESLIVADRWTFLREHSDVVEHTWVESVFEYKQSPRNLVVVGVKKAGVR